MTVHKAVQLYVLHSNKLSCHAFTRDTADWARHSTLHAIHAPTNCALSGWRAGLARPSRSHVFVFRHVMPFRARSRRLHSRLREWNAFTAGVRWCARLRHGIFTQPLDGGCCCGRAAGTAAAAGLDPAAPAFTAVATMLIVTLSLHHEVLPVAMSCVYI